MNNETITIQPQKLEGALTIPASKSVMQRACAAALLKGGTTTLYNFGISNDDNAALQTIQQLGATVTKFDDRIEIKSEFPNLKNNELNTYESGLSVRMFTPIAALCTTQITINGKGSLLQRPMHFFNEVLPQLSVRFNSNNGHLPFQIKGALQNANITIDGSLSSQFLTGLLFAFSYNNADATITVNQLTSKPYIDITLQVLAEFGLNVPTHQNYEQFSFLKKEIKTNTQFNYTVESDWSSASFFLVAAAINGNLQINGLNVFSAQADKAILQALQLANVNMSIATNEIEIRKSNLQPFHFNCNECPDLFPPLVALAANINGVSTIEGVLRLTYKESNRALTLQQEFAKLGVTIQLQDDLMIINGIGNITVNVNETYTAHNDHRIAMALAVAIQNQNENITILGSDAVNKSYPEFWQHLASLQNK